MSTNIKPFKIAVPDAEIEKLKTKLSFASFPQETLFSDDRKYGVPLKDVKRLVAYWQNGYDWRKHEAQLNKVPQFTTTINIDGFEDLEIHFVHQTSKSPDAIPLLFCHGWPGGFWEGLKILPLLVQPERGAPSFHGVSKPGFGLLQYAEVLHKVMIQLGYDKYATQGGDWGTSLTRTLGLKYPQHVVASHINMILASALTLSSHPLLALQSRLPWTAAERSGMGRAAHFYVEGTGYSKIQTTKPHTLGIALADSPTALLAWVYEKLVDWTDGYAWTDDEVLTWLSLYVFSRAGPAASIYIYYEGVHGSAGDMAAAMRWSGAVPLGLSYFPQDVVRVPNTWGRTLGPVVFEATHERGGHFAAYEVPELLVIDLRAMFGVGGGAYSAVEEFVNKARI